MVRRAQVQGKKGNWDWPSNVIEFNSRQSPDILKEPSEFFFILKDEDHFFEHECLQIPKSKRSELILGLKS